MWQSKPDASTYLAVLLLVPLVCTATLIVSILFFQNELPAPRLSNSSAFNEKARWIRENLPQKCSTLILGSSMALNNIDADILPRGRFGEQIANVASWGMSMRDSEKMLEAVAPLCKPDAIILVTNFMDFNAAWSKDIDWVLIDEYIHQSSYLITYFREFDLRDFLSAIKSRHKNSKEGTRIYQSLVFDETGTVNLACRNFKIDPRRWDGHKSRKQELDAHQRAENIQALHRIAKTVKQMNIKLYVLTPPMRHVAETSFLVDARKTLWDDVKRVVSKSGGVYLQVPGSSEFGDELFVDFAHMNACGAEKFTRQIANELAGIEKSNSAIHVGDESN